MRRIDGGVRPSAREWLDARPWSQAWAAGVLAACLALLAAHGRSSPYNNFVLLAEAFLHGHAWIDWPGPYIDALAYNGRHYVIEGPTPAVLLMPVVALFGGANQTWLAAVLAGVAIGAAWQLARNLGASFAVRVWLCAFLFAGTDLWWCAMLGDVWFIAHCSTAAFTFLALAELTGRKRGGLVALYGALAFESRFVYVLALPVYAAMLYERDEPGWRRRLLAFCAMLVPFALLWGGYNLARWGTLEDVGYTAWYHQDQVGSPVGSPFQLRYFGYELQSFFLQGPEFRSTFPYVVPTMNGLSLLWTSPALLLAFLARRPLRSIVPLVVLTIVCAGPNFIYYVNGFAQFGMRHALDFEPYLFALMVLGVGARVPLWGKVLIAYSCAVGAWGVWYWNAFYRPT